MLREQLVSEYVAYRTITDRAPNMWNAPSAREEAGYCLQYPAPFQIYDNLAADQHLTTGYWAQVRSFIEQALQQADETLAA